MANNDLKGRVDLDVAGALGALKSAQRAFRDLEKASTDAGKKMTASQRMATKAIIDEYGKLRKAQSQAVNDAITTDRKLREMERNGVNARSNSRAVTGAKVTAIETKTTDSSRESDARAELTTQRTITEEKRRQVMLAEAESRTTSRELRDQLAVRRQATREAQALARAESQASDHLAATRYALYDVSRMLIVAGAGAVALEAASIGVAIAWERDFANVVRTTGVADEGIKALKRDFVDLAQTIPESWENLTKIGTLAGQLGIDPKQITEFTRVVAQFAATTDVSVEDAATAFGRLNALLPDVNNNFEGIADAVLHVGVNSVATESQIIKISTQISALGSQANFSYDEVIGLAGALASVAVPPELSRGVVTRVFGQIGRAIADGGANLERFGKLSGMTGAEFRKEWSEDAGGTFLKFMNGIKEQGGSAEAAIRALGITSVRDVPILIRLANAADSAGKAGGLMAQTFGDAARSAGELDKQYEIMSSTISAKLQVLMNTFNSLMDALGAAQLGPLGVLLDTVTGSLRDIEAFASSDWGWLLAVGAGLAAIAGVLAILGGLAARGVAGYAALITALQGLQAAGGGASVTMATMNGMLAATGPLGAKAAGGIRALTVAMKALSLVTLVLAVPDISEFVSGVTNQITGASTEFNDRLTEAFDFTGFLEKEIVKHSLSGGAISGVFSKLFADAGMPLTDFNRKVKELDDEIVNLVASGSIDAAEKKFNNVKKTWAEAGLNADAFKTAFGDSIAAFKQADVAADSVDGLAGSTEALTEAEEEAAQAAQDLMDQFIKGDASFISLTGAMDSVREKTRLWAEGQAEATESADDSWQDFYDGQSFNFQGYIAELQAQVDAQTAWETNMVALAGRVSEETLAELGRLGPEGAPLVAELVNASDEELQRFDTLFAQAGTDAGTQFAVALINTQTLIADVGSRLGGAAKTELMTRLAAGEDFNSLLAEYTTRMNNLKMDVPPPSLAKPQSAIDSFIYRNSGRSVYVDIAVRNNALAGLKDASGRPINVGQFDSGGYTGDGGKLDPAGIVHRGEFVFTKQATEAIGVPNLYGIMRAAQTHGYAGGGSVTKTSASYVPSFGGSMGRSGGMSSFATLDAQSIQAILAMADRPIYLYTTDRKLASSVNNGGTQLARQGTN